MGGVRAHILAAAGFCLAIAGIGMGCSGAAADTLEWALVQAYQNNPSLNAQRASLRATDENVPQALSGYRPKLSVTAGGGYNYNNAVQQFPVGGRHQHTVRPDILFTYRRRHRLIHAVQRLPDRQPHPAGRKPGRCCARDLARHRAAGFARCRNRLHEFVAGSRDPRSQSPQRRGAHRAAQADPRPLQCRRSHPHRRRSGGIAAWPPADPRCSAPSRTT